MQYILLESEMQLLPVLQHLPLYSNKDILHINNNITTGQLFLC